MNYELIGIIIFFSGVLVGISGGLYFANALNSEADLVKMRGALRRAHDTFLHYARIHEQKGTEEADIKAKRNRNLANIMRDAMQ